MTVPQSCNPARPPVSRFMRARGGNVAMMFGLLLVPICLAVFASIDFYRASVERSNLQDALDAAALVAARTQSDDPDVIQRVGVAALQAGLANAEGIRLLTDQTRFTPDDGRVVAEAAVQVSPWVLGLFRHPGLITTAQSQIVRGQTNVEVAMVLDVTGSMNESSGGVSKIARLREAATALVNTLEQSSQGSSDPNAVRISMVPFSASVNVGAANRNAPWIVNNATHQISNQLFTNNGTAPVNTNRFVLLNQIGAPWGGCVESRPEPFDVTDTQPTSGQPLTMFVPYFAPDEPGAGDGFTLQDYNAGLWYYNDYLPDDTGSTDRRVMQGRPGKYDQPPSITGQTLAGTGYNYGPNFGCLTSTIVPLTTNFSALRNSIAALTAAGDTNIPLGAMWGWHTLAPGAPFNNATAYGNPDVRKIMIIMTDGNNTYADVASPNHNRSMYTSLAYIGQGRLGITNGTAAQRTARMDQRLAQLCRNMRDRGVTVYTVRVEVSDGSSDVLRNCATEQANYYDVQNAAQLTDVFRSIAGSITRMRIAH